MLNIRHAQYQALRRQAWPTMAEEIASALASVCSRPDAIPSGVGKIDFIVGQFQRAEAVNLHRNDEMTAFVLCALVFGSHFETKMQEVQVILKDVNYDRANLLADLAIRRLKQEPTHS